MDIKVDTHDAGIAIVEFTGRLDFLATASVKRRLAEIVSDGYPRLIINLQHVSFMDSSGLTTLISGLKSARLAGGDIRIANPSEEAQTILELTKLDQVMQVYKRVEDALKGF